MTFLYDQNGNLRTNGSVVMAYDDENQLTAITNAGAWASTFTYDGKMRMRISKDFAWVAGAWVQTNEVRRVYDGMLVLQERNNLGVPTLTYTRGLDLSGSLEGAGGIGGLLALSDHSTLNSSSPQPASFYFHSDGNGNVTCLADANQNVVARYLYDPFGNTLSATGPKAALNKYRFSSKEWHASSGMVYYGYRLYVPELQRWLNPDPEEEDGGLNLYQFNDNAPNGYVDPDGLAPVAIPFPPLCPPMPPPAIPAPPPALACAAAAAYGYAAGVYIGESTGFHDWLAEQLAKGLVICMAEHTKNARPSTKGKHEKGERDKGRKKWDKKRQHPGWKSVPKR